MQDATKWLLTKEFSRCLECCFEKVFSFNLGSWKLDASHKLANVCIHQHVLM